MWRWPSEARKQVPRVRHTDSEASTFWILVGIRPFQR